MTFDLHYLPRSTVLCKTSDLVSFSMMLSLICRTLEHCNMNTGRVIPRSFMNFGIFLGLLTLNSNVNKLFEISKLSQNLNMGVHGMVFWGVESIFEVRFSKFQIFGAIWCSTLTLSEIFAIFIQIQRVIHGLHLIFGAEFINDINFMIR